MYFTCFFSVVSPVFNVFSLYHFSLYLCRISLSFSISFLSIISPYYFSLSIFFSIIYLSIFLSIISHSLSRSSFSFSRSFISLISHASSRLQLPSGPATLLVLVTSVLLELRGTYASAHWESTRPMLVFSFKCTGNTSRVILQQRDLLRFQPH